MTVRYLIGDVLEVLPTLDAGSVDLVLTSPPFLALRSYLPADHPDKAKEGGSQPTPGAFIDWLVDVVEALDRVLAPHGSMVIELGDTYAGSGGPSGDSLGNGLLSGSREGAMPAGVFHSGPGWPAIKSLTLIPELFRTTLVYGFNPLTGRQTKRWRLRNVIRWVRPNPPVGALGDKFRPATSELMVFCRTDEAGRRRFFDLDAVREPTNRTDRGGIYKGSLNTTDAARAEQGEKANVAGSNPNGAPPLDWWNIPLLDGEEPTPYGPKPPEPTAGGPYRPGRKPVPDRNPSHGWGETPQGRENPNGPPPLDWWNVPLSEGEEPTRYGSKAPTRKVNRDRVMYTSPDRHDGQSDQERYTSEHPNGAPPLDWWEIPPGGYSGAHYAVFPEALCVRPIKAMCPEKVCRTCGEASRRIVEKTPEYAAFRESKNGNKWQETPNYSTSWDQGDDSGARGLTHTTLGFSDCSHDNYRPGLVLDPFAGSGTTLAVAVGHGRDAIGIDLDSRNVALARGRIGLFLDEVVDAGTETDRSDHPLLAEGGAAQ